MADLSKFDPTNIISDEIFYDSNAMTANEIQSFLDSRIGNCQNGRCLNVLQASVSSRDARHSSSTGNLICNAIQGGTMRVSELIYRVQVACGISAKVILVTLQKEQGLTTSRAPSDWNLNAAMGQACPDTAPCDPAFKGIGPQIVGGVTQLKTYKAAEFGKRPGNNYIQYNPNAGCGGTNLNIKNWATASLYTYTPYQPNAASLRAGYGIGDGCSSYGNRNFYQYYVDWFGSTQFAGGDPFGAVDSWELTGTGVRVSGWTIDPDTTAPTSIRVKSNEEQILRDTAGGNRTDIGQAYPTYGSKHGFIVDVPLIPGTQTVCVVANNIGVGANRTLGCRELTPSGGDPYGAVTSVERIDGGVRVTGWTIDPDTTDPVTVRVKLDEVQAARLTADRADVKIDGKYRLFGAAHGFVAEIKLPPGRANLCIAMNNVGVGVNRTIQCSTVTGVGGSPFGQIESWNSTIGGVTVKGWVIDPDVVGPVDIRVKANEELVARASASDERSTLTSSYPGFGTAHGFEVAADLAPGVHTVCVTANNVGSGVNRTLGCSTITVLGGSPLGEVEAWTPVVGGVSISGWTLDPDIAGPISIRVKSGGTLVSRITANAPHEGVGDRYPAYGDAHGFTANIPLPPGSQNVCVVANNAERGSNTTLGCRSLEILSGGPLGQVESWKQTAGAIEVTGWAFDPDVVDPATIRVKVDDVLVERVVATQLRDDIGSRYPAYGANRGFSARVALAPGRHTVCVVANNVAAGSHRALGCRTVSISSDPAGAITSWEQTSTGVRITGWAIDPDTSYPIGLRVKSGETLIARATASGTSEASLADFPGHSSAHGFDVTVALPRGAQRVCVVMNNVGDGANRSLPCRNVNIR